MGRLRIGLIGTDREALRFYEANRYGTGIEVTAVCGRTLEETREFAARKGKLALFTSPTDLAASEICDAVFVSGPCTLTGFRKVRLQDESGESGEDQERYYHRQEIITLMLEAGKHVICQAPLALTEQQARDLFGIARDRDLILMECLNSVYTPAFAKMREQASRLGTFREAYLHCCHRTPAFESYKKGGREDSLAPAMGGGALYHYGIQLAACAVRLFGQPEKVVCLRNMLDDQMEGSAVILIEYPGLQVTLNCSMMADLAAPSHIMGEEGSMLISSMENVKDIQVYRPMVKQVFHYEQSDNTYGPVTQAFAAMVRGEGDPVSARELSLGTIEILTRARKSSRTSGEMTAPSSGVGR